MSLEHAWTSPHSSGRPRLRQPGAGGGKFFGGYECTCLFLAYVWDPWRGARGSVLHGLYFEDSANEVVAHIPLAETSREAMPASGSEGKDSPSEEGTPDPGEHGTACHAGSAGQPGALHPPSPQGSLVLFPSYYVSQSLRMLRHWLSISYIPRNVYFIKRGRAGEGLRLLSCCEPALRQLGDARQVQGMLVPGYANGRGENPRRGLHLLDSCAVPALRVCRALC